MKPPFKNISTPAPFIALLGACALFLWLTGQAAAGWSSPVQVTQADAAQSAVTVDPRTGHAHIVWYEENGTYWYAECLPTWNWCSPPVQIHSGAIANPGPRVTLEDLQRPAIAIDSQGNLYAGFANPASSLGTAFLYRKSAGATTWLEWIELGPGWQVRLATAPNNAIDVVWGTAGTINYRRYDSSRNLLAEQTGLTGENAALVTDTFGNAHLVYEGPHPIYSRRTVWYTKFSANGEKSQTQQVYDTAGEAMAPDLALDASNRLHFVWTETLAISTVRYMRCDAGALTNCTDPLALNSDGIAGDQPTVTTVGGNFFVSYRQVVGDNTHYVMLYDGRQASEHALHQVETQPGGFFPAMASDPRTGWLHLTYRYRVSGSQPYLRYRYYAVGSSHFTPMPTSTATPTATPPLTVFPRIAPLNLSQSRAVDRAPAITIDENGNLTVAWEQANGTTRNIVARVAGSDGTFGAAHQISVSPSSIRPNLFSNSTETYAVFQEGTGLAHTVLSGDTWSPISHFKPIGTIVGNPQGARATDGTIWFGWMGTTASRRNVWAMPLNGEPVQLSSSGYATSPAITAGDNGAVFVTWAEKVTVVNKSRIKVSQWNGTTWASLPGPTVAGTQPALAYRAGKLLAVWIDGATIRQRSWDGSAWGPTSRVSTGLAPTGPRVVLSTSGNPSIVWSDSGRVLLSTNGGAARVISGSIPNASTPSLLLDNQETLHVVFANGEVWYLVIR